MTKHMYFSLDSDVLSNLAELDEFLEHHPNATNKDIIDKFKNRKQDSVIKHLDMYTKYLNIAKDKNSPIRFLVTQTPWKESCHIEAVNDFIRKYCYVPRVNYLQQNNIKREIIKLARSYCKSYTNHKGEKKEAPMSIKYNADKGELAPSNDAYVMAEATVFGACVLTENKKDFINMEQEESTSAYGNNKRALGIIELNKIFGYEVAYDEHFRTVSKPWAVDHLGKFLDNLEDFKGHLCADSNFEEAQL